MLHGSYIARIAHPLQARFLSSNKQSILDEAVRIAHTFLTKNNLRASIVEKKNKDGIKITCDIFELKAPFNKQSASVQTIHIPRRDTPPTKITYWFAHTDPKHRNKGLLTCAKTIATHYTLKKYPTIKHTETTPYTWTGDAYLSHYLYKPIIEILKMTSRSLIKRL